MYSIQSLGYARASMVMNDDGSGPQLKYFDGAKCTEDETQDYATQIDFRCDPRAGKVSFICPYPNRILKYF